MINIAKTHQQNHENWLKYLEHIWDKLKNNDCFLKFLDF